MSNEPHYDEIQEMRRILENGYAEDLASKALRIKQVKTDLTNNIKVGIPVKVTEEMRMLGIEVECANQIAKAEIEARMKRLYTDEDDDPQEAFEPHRPIFF